MRPRQFGLYVCNDNRATPGYMLFTPLQGKTTYLIGLHGDVVHQWQHPYTPGNYAYLL